MKTTIKLAVASALLASAAGAQAAGGIVAGDWTLDIGGNVNAFYTTTRTSGDDTLIGGGFGALGGGNDNGESSQNNITTGLLPNFLSVSGKTRQNDLDVGFTISMNPGASTRSAASSGGANENRQAFLTFGDKSWGSIKLGKDLGIFGSDAILSDMTLLGVGSGAGFRSATTTTLGRIGTGYIYADWKSQIAYTSPNWNGFSFTAGLTQAWDSIDIIGGTGTSAVFNDAVGKAGKGGMPTFEAKASYEWAGDVSGKAWVGALSQKYELAAGGSERGNAWEIGANVNVAGFGLTGYYYDGKGVGTTGLGLGALDTLGKRRDSDGYYVQATYTIPGVGTKIGASYGRSNLDANSAATDAMALVGDLENDMWTVGVYHPLTKHLNLVAEYSDAQTDMGALDSKAKTFSAGAILFF